MGNSLSFLTPLLSYNKYKFNSTNNLGKKGYFSNLLHDIYKYSSSSSTLPSSSISPPTPPSTTKLEGFNIISIIWFVLSIIMFPIIVSFFI